MQKIMICVDRPDSFAQNDWNHQLAQLLAEPMDNIYHPGYALVDDDIAAAHLLVMHNTSHPKDALLTVWTDNFQMLEPLFKHVSEFGQYQAYVVSESSAIVNKPARGRVEGMCQVALLKKPEAQSRLEWQHAWLGNHTQVAIDTQSTFGYRQNVVALPLPLKPTVTPKWPLMDAIVEENFPDIAMTSREAFFAAEGEPEKFEQHQQIMMQSCFKFIDFEAFDCTPMSQYVL